MTQSVSSATRSTDTTSTQNSVSKNATIGKDEFLKLLTYQLKSQNPMKPYDNQEFAAQLAQFSQLETMVDIRSLLEEQASTNSLLTQTISNSALPGMIGKTAKASSSTLIFDGSTPIDAGFDNPYNAASGKLIITDSAGKVIHTQDLSSTDLNKGSHSFRWDGTNLNGDISPNGNYNMSVELKEANGTGFSADTFIKGKIDAVRFKSEGTMIVINGMEVPLNSISDISSGN
jgi:flagellar basal-body rod modification protein FlgD